MNYIPQKNIAIVFGGRNDEHFAFSGAAYLNDVWVLSLDRLCWQQWNPGSQASVPVARYSHAAAVIGSAVVVFGGLSDENYCRADIHALDMDSVSSPIKPSIILHNCSKDKLDATQRTEELMAHDDELKKISLIEFPTTEEDPKFPPSPALLPIPSALEAPAAIEEKAKETTAKEEKRPQPLLERNKQLLLGQIMASPTHSSSARPKHDVAAIREEEGEEEHHRSPHRLSRFKIEAPSDNP